MKKILASFVVAVLSCVIAVCAGCTDGNDGKKPELLKDGAALTITAGETESIDLSEYISIEGTEYAYAAESSDSSVATVSVEGNTATVTAVAAGSAEITASADAVQVKFAVTVNKKAEQPKPAPVFKDRTVTYDLKDKQSERITLAPESGEATYRYSYALKATDKFVTINGDKLTAAYTSATVKTLTVVAKYTDGAGSFIGERTVEFKVNVTVTDTREPDEIVPPELKESAVTVEKDLFEENASSFTIDFAENVNNPGNVELRFTVKKGEEDVKLTGSTYNFVYETYDETAITVVYSVEIAYNLDGEDGSLEYAYTLSIKDTSAYRVTNGSFDNGLEGWTTDGDIGVISDKSTFWEQQYPVFNEGKYFLGEGKEAGKGTLKSSLFKVGGANKITFMLGAAGNKDCYITLERADGTALEIWRNAKFEDIGDWKLEEIGKTQFACNLVTYVADLSAYAGETVRIVLNDNAERAFGFFNFDELVTYYATAEEVPAGVATVNEIADKTALKEAVDGVITEQGDYTEESFAEYTQKVTAARSVLEKFSATQEEANIALSELRAAETALALREPEEIADAEKTVVVFVGNSKELAISDYVDDKKLSEITCTVEASGSIITVGNVENGKFALTALAEKGSATVTITVRYKGEIKLTVTLTVKVEEETAPELKENTVEANVDLFSLEDKEKITLDFAENVNNVGGLKLGFTATKDGQQIELDGSRYTLTFGTYSETATTVVFNVKVAYSVNGVAGEKAYTYNLNIKDTTEFQIVNGSFDNDLEGWTLSNTQLGAVNADKTYWIENVPFNADGKFFNAYAFGDSGKDAIESAMGTLTSSAFKLGGSGWITYKLGGAKNADKVFLDVIEKSTGAILARYYNNAFYDDNSQTAVRGCTLLAYKADLSEYVGKTVYIRLSDNAAKDYGLFFADSFVTYYASEDDLALIPNTATPAPHPNDIYQIYNGGFDSGLQGWYVETTDDANGGGEFGVLSDVENETWGVNNGPYNNDGNFFKNGNEASKGYLQSNAFTVSENGWLTFKLGGNSALSYVAILDADTGEELARFVNKNFVGDWGNNKGWEMYAYKVNLIESGIPAGTEVRIKVVDDATNDYGVVVVDSFATHTADPGDNFEKTDKVTTE